jgi:prepilin-type N-terminal cleavage/methylation domain-containing protein/prepilin-type processing-associated H-X9-DG protein
MKPCSEHVLPARTGFTLVELVVVVVMVGLLATMLAPTMARTKPNSASFQCQNNLRQLTFSWKMYADDNNGNLVYNGEGGGYPAGTAAWVGGWMDYSASSDNTNTGLLIDHDKYPYCAFLGPYLKTPLAFKCPADRSTALMAGGPMPRVRSVSMNSRVGTGSSTWSRYGVGFPLCSNFAQIKLPAYMFVLLDEREDSINDGCFSTDPNTLYQIVDYPASYHNNAGSFSFADGHAEIHHWKDRRTMPALQPGQPLTLNVNMPRNVDVLWLAQHAAGLAKYP